MYILERLLNPALIWIFIPIAWLLFSTIVEIIKIAQRHRERMALINQGIHPDLDGPTDPASSAVDDLDESLAEVKVVLRETADYPSAT